MMNFTLYQNDDLLTMSLISNLELNGLYVWFYPRQVFTSILQCGTTSIEKKVSSTFWVFGTKSFQLIAKRPRKAEVWNGHSVGWEFRVRLDLEINRFVLANDQ